MQPYRKDTIPVVRTAGMKPAARYTHVRTALVLAGAS